MLRLLGDTSKGTPLPKLAAFCRRRWAGGGDAGRGGLGGSALVKESALRECHIQGCVTSKRTPNADHRWMYRFTFPANECNPDRSSARGILRRARSRVFTSPAEARGLELRVSAGRFRDGSRAGNGKGGRRDEACAEGPCAEYPSRRGGGDAQGLPSSQMWRGERLRGAGTLSSRDGGREDSPGG